MARSPSVDGPEAGNAGTSPAAAAAAAPKRKSVLPPKPPVDLLAELRDLRARMEDFRVTDTTSLSLGGVDAHDEWSERLQRLAGSSSLADQNGTSRRSAEEGHERMESNGESSSARAAPKLSELDKRLATLEDLVGHFGAADEVDFASSRH